MRWVLAALLVHLVIFLLPLSPRLGPVTHRVRVTVAHTSKVNLAIELQKERINLEDISRNINTMPDTAVLFTRTGHTAIKYGEPSPRVAKANTPSDPSLLQHPHEETIFLDRTHAADSSRRPMRNTDKDVMRESMVYPELHAGTAPSVDERAGRFLESEREAIRRPVRSSHASRIDGAEPVSLVAGGHEAPATALDRFTSSRQPCCVRVDDTRIGTKNSRPEVLVGLLYSSLNPVHYFRRLPAPLFSEPGRYPPDSTTEVVQQPMGRIAPAGERNKGVCLPLVVKVKEANRPTGAPVPIASIAERKKRGVSKKVAPCLRVKADLPWSSMVPNYSPGASAFDRLSTARCTHRLLQPMAPVSEAYLALLSEHIMNRKTYPEDAREKGMEGQVVVRFELLREGRVRSCTIVTGSGQSVIDRAALELIEDAQPFPPFFPRMKQQSLMFQLEVIYDLEEPER